ncbi:MULTISPECIES: hypothetical protein [Lactiplantibacillus]|uniref:LptM family lipoprotein n=1 Tax=Lactiplantibacillus TaxID=2767842 RepID=UPI000FF3F2F6|nr:MULTISPECIES: hypothetical protein [Lactiplantibacillus]MCG0798408.1 prophage P2a protein 7 [Lactiplantibacillus plantarum]MCM8654856.1 hypothetical protein [Lactiplantibacillus sp. C232]MDB7779103.1 hypothetical protein [Lactiplantibacillus plantarum]MDB7788080.1 hypothetical protein [Lactiplantibacillus plantarum]MDB7791159.1 hypothetical protein [Lactiplantibacillus plantarum]
MKKMSIGFVAIIAIIFTLAGCGNKKPDYTASTAESALNANKDIEGKTVQFKVNKVVPNSAFGYNLETGKHLNFVSSENPKVNKGETVTVKVKKTSSSVGSWVISYTNLKRD